jgi:protein ImuB
MGESRVGAPVVLDTHDPRKSSLKPFSAPASALRATAGAQHSSTRALEHGSTVIRRFRHPMPVRVTADRGIPLRLGPTSSIQSQSKGGRVVHRAGPWRTSGQWWTADRDTWDRDEWDVAVDSGVVYRLSRDRTTDRWEVEGVID